MSIPTDMPSLYNLRQRVPPQFPFDSDFVKSGPGKKVGAGGTAFPRPAGSGNDVIKALRALCWR